MLERLRSGEAVVISPRTFHHLANAVATSQRLERHGATPRHATARGIVLACVTAWKEVAPHRYRYAWMELGIDREGEVFSRPEGRHGTVDDNYAINIAERMNLGTGWLNSGVLIDEVIPEFRFQPVGGGRETTSQTEGPVGVEVPVLLMPRRFPADPPEFPAPKVLWLFSETNGLHGKCSE